MSYSRAYLAAAMIEGLFHGASPMGVDRVRRAAGWACAATVAVLLSMSYHFANIRFVPVAVGFAILAGVCLLMGGAPQVESNGVHPGTDSGIGRAGG